MVNLVMFADSDAVSAILTVATMPAGGESIQLPALTDRIASTDDDSEAGDRGTGMWRTSSRVARHWQKMEGQLSTYMDNWSARLGRTHSVKAGLPLMSLDPRVPAIRKRRVRAPRLTALRFSLDKLS